ncbi:MAG: aldo/keto reductase [Pseudomonadota bacterium]
MRTVSLPQTDLEVTPLCLGTNFFGSSIPEDQAFRLMDAYIEAGGAFLDTANCYSAWLPDGEGASERTIGKWLKKTGLRDRITLATKGGNPLFDGLRAPRLSAADFRQDLSQSLERLGVETIDLYWVHKDAPEIPVESILEALASIVESGRIRYVGCSNWAVDRIDVALRLADEKGLPRFIAAQPMWSAALPTADYVTKQSFVAVDGAMARFLAEREMACIPFSSQATGVFSKVAAGGVESLSEDTLFRYGRPENWRRFEVMRDLAAQHGRPISQIALSFLTSQTVRTVPIVGGRTPEQIKDSMAAADLHLSAEEVGRIEAADAGG